MKLKLTPKALASPLVLALRSKAPEPEPPPKPKPMFKPGKGGSRKP